MENIYPDDNAVDLTIEKLVAEHYAKNFKDGMITPDYCMELISRASQAEAINELLAQANESLQTELEECKQRTFSIYCLLRDKAKQYWFKIPDDLCI